MRAVRQHELGGPEVLVVDEVPRPEPLPTEVLVRVIAAGINPVDCKTRAGGGLPGIGDLPFTVGWDVSGIVEEVGPGVTRFAVGDPVFGMPWFPRQAAAYAEYVTAPSRQFTRKPFALDHRQAGALPLAGLTAWQILVDTARLSQGQTVLIHGAAGGVGHLAVQIAHALGARVVGTARAEQADFLHGLGADQVIDYRNEKFEDLVDGVDLVVDFPTTNGERSLPVLADGGLLVSVSAAVPEDLISQGADAGKSVTGFLVEPDHLGLDALASLAADGKLRVHVDATFPLAEAAAAHRMAEGSHGGGKIVLNVAEV